MEDFRVGSIPTVPLMNEGTFIRLRTDEMGILKPGLAFASVIWLAGEEKLPKVSRHVRGSWRARVGLIAEGFEGHRKERGNPQRGR